MQLDLNCLLGEIHTWKNIVKNKDEEIENLQNQIKECKQHIENIDNSNSTLMQEIVHQNTVISSLYQSFTILDKTEADNKALVEEIEKLKFNVKEQEKLHLKENNELKTLINELETKHKKEVEHKISNIENNVSSELEQCALNIREKENYIFMLKEEISKVKQEKEQEILKIQIECEEKLGRMRLKFSKNKGIYHHDFKSNDFFRQKYIEKGKEAKEEAAKLKKEIEDLKSEIALLKSNDIFSVAAQHDDALKKEQFYRTDKSNHFDEEYPPTKRTKMKGDDSQDDSINGFDIIDIDNTKNDFIQCSYTSSSVRRQPSAATLFKKKLFNLDTNYFNK